MTLVPMELFLFYTSIKETKFWKMGQNQHLHTVVSEAGQKGISMYLKGSQTALSSSMSQIEEYNHPPSGQNNPQGEI